jgi:hypothetical protein
MKVKQLIAELSKLDPDLMIVRAGYEGGVVEITGVGTCNIALDVFDEWYYGPHDLVTEPSSHPEAEVKTAVFVS